MRRSGLISLNYWGTLLALASSLVVAGVPLLHARVHEVSHAPHAHLEGAEVDERPHDDVHPLLLHDDWSLSQNYEFDFAAALPKVPDQAPSFTVSVGEALRAPEGNQPRAPPASIQARAPPLV